MPAPHRGAGVVEKYRSEVISGDQERRVLLRTRNHVLVCPVFVPPQLVAHTDEQPGVLPYGRQQFGVQAKLGLCAVAETVLALAGDVLGIAREGHWDPKGEWDGPGGVQHQRGVEAHLLRRDAVVVPLLVRIDVQNAESVGDGQIERQTGREGLFPGRELGVQRIPLEDEGQGRILDWPKLEFATGKLRKREGTAQESIELLRSSPSASGGVVHVGFQDLPEHEVRAELIAAGVNEFVDVLADRLRSPWLCEPQPPLDTDLVVAPFEGMARHGMRKQSRCS